MVDKTETASAFPVCQGGLWDSSMMDKTDFNLFFWVQAPFSESQRLHDMGYLFY